MTRLGEETDELSAEPEVVDDGTGEQATVLVTEPADGIPEITDTPEALARTIRALASGTGPIALDTERAQGFRYTAKAYLIQLRRQGSGTHLVDPVAFEDGRERADLSALREVISDEEWILHAASQDLPCLAEVQLWPVRLFDTELAARLLGIPRVNLGALMEQALGISLLKEHSADDWSRRPLPEAWLAYAALDVERLDDLRDWLIDELTRAGKLDWADQEFAHLAAHARDLPAPPADPWRRTSGLHSVRSGLGLAVVRALWQARDELASEADRGPGRILNDHAISEIAAVVETSKKLPTRAELRKIRGFTMRSATRYEAVWLEAIGTALQLPRSALPPRQLASAGPPQPRSWQARWPESYERWSRVRPALVERAEDLQVPVENLISPDVVKRLLWESTPGISAEHLQERLVELGARQWQRELVTPVILAAWD